MALLNVGMPGVGLGGIFYLLAALAMPVVEAARAVDAWLAGMRRPQRARRWGLALRQAALALGVLGAAWLTGLAIARGVPATRVVRQDSAGEVVSGTVVARKSPIRTGTLAFGAGLLVVVLGSVELLRLATRAPRRREEQLHSLGERRRMGDAA
jgi:hypothetical protein